MWTLNSHQTPLHSILSRRQTRRRRVKQHQHVVSFHNLSPFNLSIPLTIAYLHHTFSTWLVQPQVEWSNKRQEQKQLQHVQAEISRGTFPVPSPLVPPLDLVVEPKRALRAAELALMSFRRNTGMSLQQKVRGNMAKLDMAIMKGFLCLTYLWPNLNLAIWLLFASNKSRRMRISRAWWSCICALPWHPILWRTEDPRFHHLGSGK